MPRRSNDTPIQHESVRAEQYEYLRLFYNQLDYPPSQAQTELRERANLAHAQTVCTRLSLSIQLEPGNEENLFTTIQSLHCLLVSATTPMEMYTINLTNVQIGPANIKIKLGIRYIQLAATRKHLYHNI